MDLSNRVGVFAALAILALAAAGLAHDLLRNWRERRDQRRLDETGLTATGRVLLVEPMQRRVNGGAGHPVQLEFVDSAGRPRQFRDTSGLGGYVVRTGTQVTVRYSATDPALVRVEEVHGPGGRYRPEHRRRTASVVPGLLALPGVVIGGVAIAIYEFDALSLPRLGPAFTGDLVPLVFGLIGLAILSVTGGFAIRRLVTRRPRQEVVGVVTEVWEELINTGRHSREVHPFTVHFATLDGREVHTRYRIAGSRRLALHQRVRVRYDPAYPPSFDVAELRYAVWLLWSIPSLIGAVFLMIGGFWLLARLG